MENERLKSVRDSASAKCWPSKAPPLNVELMRDWTEEDAKRYFESGGLFFPASMAPDGSRRLCTDWHAKGDDARAETIVATAHASKNVSATSDGSTSNHGAAEAGVPSFLAAAALAKRCEKGWQGSVSAVRAAHILVDSREKALMVKREIDAGQLTFAQAAGQYSMDPSGKESGGDLGTFHPGDMVRAFDRYCFNPNTVPNTIGLVKSEFGTHLIKVIGGAKQVRVLAVTAGLSASVFATWQLPLGMDLDNRGGKAMIIPLTLQAYGKTLRETAVSLAGVMGEQLDAVGVDPCVVLGHGLGAWLALEALRHLSSTAAQGRRPPMPDLLIVSGIRPPHLWDAAEHDADRETPVIAELPSAPFWSAFRRRYGVDPDLDDVRDMFEPALREELRLLERHRPQPPPAGEAPFRLPCDLIACAAKGDPRLKPGQLQEWSEYVGAYKGFEVVELPPPRKAAAWATPHRYLLDGSPEAQRMLAARCVRLSENEVCVARPLSEFGVNSSG